MHKVLTHHYILNSLLLGALLLGVLGCNPDPDPEPDGNTLDQGALLTNLGRNLMVPAYQDFARETGALKDAAAAFRAQPESATLLPLRAAFAEAYLGWVSTSTFEIGPASDRALRANVNTFPADTAVIHQNIQSGSYDLAAASNLVAKGLPALDYLLYGVGDTEADVLAYFNANAAAADYMLALATDLDHLVREVLGAWESGYLQTFEDAQGTDVGSSLGQFVNQFNFDYELLKKPRLGIPMGQQTLGTALPEKAEGYFSGLSLDLMRSHFSSIRTLYFGGETSPGADNFYGLHEALISLEAQYNGGSLAEAIAVQISATENALAAIQGPRFEDAVANETATLQAAYQEVQKLLVLFKTDMSSALGVLITYVDNDGD